MIPDQLGAGISVLIYAGDQDYICNWLGNRAWTQVIERYKPLYLRGVIPTIINKLSLFTHPFILT